MKDTPADYNDGDLLDTQPHNRPRFIKRTAQGIGLLFFVLIALMLLVYSTVWR